MDVQGDFYAQRYRDKIGQGMVVHVGLRILAFFI